VGKSGAKWGVQQVGAPPVNKMAPQETVETKCYNSLYRHGVDDKRRVQIPAKWRPEKPGTEFTLVLWPKAKEGPCLNVLPPQQVAELIRELEAMPNSDPSKGVLKRVIGSGSVQAPLDKSGRICLPEGMAKEAGINDQAVLVGCLTRFEIWSPERHAKVEASDAVMSQEAFKMME
jgi:MraZ protein